MSVLIINFSLKNKSKDYSPLYSAIQENSLEWWHFLESTWIVTTTYSADAFARTLFPHIEDTDYLLVAKLHSEHQGWLPKEAWEWLNDKQY